MTEFCPKHLRETHSRLFQNDFFLKRYNDGESVLYRSTKFRIDLIIFNTDPNHSPTIAGCNKNTYIIKCYPLTQNSKSNGFIIWILDIAT